MEFRCGLVGLLLVTAVTAQTPNAHWRLDESMGTTASDSSPNGNTGTLVNFATPTWGPGQLGNAITFDGVDDYVDCLPNAGVPFFDGTGRAYSYTAWVNGPPTEDDRFYSEGSTTNNQPLFTLGTGRASDGTQDRLQLFIRNDAGGVLINRRSTAVVFDNTWHHIAVVDSGGGNVVAYVDGVADATDFTHGLNGTFLSQDTVTLGVVRRSTLCCFFTGSLDDMRAYPFALNEGDVSLVMNDLPLVVGYQTNQPGAGLVLEGAAASQFTPALATVPVSGSFTLALSTNLSGPWDLALDVGGATVPNGIALSQNIVNLNIAGGGLAFANGGFSSNFAPSATIPGLGQPNPVSTASLTFTAPASPLNVAFQFVMLNPASADGLSLSGAAELSIQ